MRSLPLMRTEYWNLSTNTVRSGNTAHIESLTDVENYLLPQAQVGASSLYTWGVADGLLVSAVPTQPGVTIAPGVALDAAGHLIALAANGFAIVDPTVDPNQVQNIPTVRVDPTGVVLSTAGLSGECFLTLTWREVLDPNQPPNAPVLLHAPWLRLLGIADFQDTGDQVILARVTLDTTGLVTGLSVEGRRLVGLPASRLELRRPRAAPAPTLSVDHLPAAELRARADGGLELNLLPLNSPPWPALTIGAAAGSLALAPQGGNVGIGTVAPTQKLDVVGTVKATAFQGSGAGLTEVSGTDTTKVAKTGDTMTGLLRITAAGTGLHVTNNASVEGTLTVESKVGIGTLTPGAKLEVIGSSWDQHLRLTNTGTGGAGPGIFFNAVNRDWAIIGTNGTAGAGDQKLGFFDATSNQYRMVIDPSGNIGIGTLTPGAKLEVIGSSWDQHLRLTNTGTGGAGPGIFFNAVNRDWAIIGTNGTAGAGDQKLGFFDATSNQYRMVIDPSGNIGIGTNNPQARLDVRGGVNVFGPVVTQQAHTIKIGVVSPANRYGNDGIRGEPNLWLDAFGTVFIKQGFQAVGGFDIAERFKSVGQVYAGQVVVFDAQVAAVKLCNRAYDSRVIGIASAEPAFILGVDQEQMPIALCGRVPCNVDADIAPIAVGDLLTTSPTSGHAQKVLEHGKATGAIIGKALGALDRGKGKIPVLVMLH